MTIMPSSKRTDELRAPGALRMALEWRAPWELGAGIAALPLLSMAPQGDGHPVLVFPGLIASDMSTGLLRRYLKGQNYAAKSWKLGRNLGPRPGVLEGCERHVEALHARYGCKVSLIGWSLGGIYARETAKALADKVRCVITLGTPFAGSPRATNAWRVYEAASGERVDDRRDWEELKKAPPVPTTSIYSRTDGIVAWQCSFQEPGATAENIEVDASHVGLGVHPAVLYAIADRLAQPEDRWRPFDRSGLRQLVYRDPHAVDWFPASCLL
jgi:pimeloyl-ACP methyl ester carboxylesterase